MADERILLIEDDIPLAQALQDFLEDRDFHCTWEDSGDGGLKQAREGEFELIVLDRMLPGISGIELCTTLRREHITTPIIFLTAKGSEQDRIDGLNAGADDYLPKPFSSPELLARISAILRRSKPVERLYHFGKNSLDCTNHQLIHDGSPCALTAKEYELLLYFLRATDRLISRGELLEKIWGYSSSQLTRTIDIHIASLRQKIEVDPKDPQLLRTLHRQGYCFSSEKKQLQ